MSTQPELVMPIILGHLLNIAVNMLISARLIASYIRGNACLQLFHWFVEISDCKEGDCFSKPPTYSCSWNGKSPTDSFDILFGNDCVKTETHMFMKACLDDEAVGGIVVGLALFFLFLSVS